MDALLELYDLLAVTFGTASFWVLIVSELLLLTIGLYLALVVRSQHTLTLYFPLTFLPVFMGGLGSCLTLSSALTYLRLNDSADSGMQGPLLLLGMSAMPMLFGIVVTFPACFVVAAGRVWIMWQANRKPKPPRTEKPLEEQSTPRSRDAVAMDADDYMAELVKLRR
jgi:hypothetical protein